MALDNWYDNYSTIYHQKITTAFITISQKRQSFSFDDCPFCFKVKSLFYCNQKMIFSSYPKGNFNQFLIFLIIQSVISLLKNFNLLSYQYKIHSFSLLKIICPKGLTMNIAVIEQDQFFQVLNLILTSWICFC